MSFKSASLTAVFAASTMVAASVFAAAPARAGSIVNCSVATCNLGSLITNGDSFVIDGDKTYSDFRAVFTGTGGSPSSAADIQVGRASVGSGISFFFPGVASANQLRNISLEYTLAGIGSKLIDSMGLSMASGVVGKDAFVLVKELINGPSGGDTDLFTYELGNGQKLKSDFAQFTATQQVRVQKDIQLYGGASGIASLSIVNQNTVPTPALLPGLLGMGIAAVRRQRKQTAELA
jgi:hypothetical protein